MASYLLNKYSSLNIKKCKFSLEMTGEIYLMTDFTFIFSVNL